MKTVMRPGHDGATPGRGRGFDAIANAVDLRQVFARSLVATHVAMAASVLVLVVGGGLAEIDWRTLPPPAWLVGFVVLTPVGVTALYRGGRGRRWAAARERRWIFAGAHAGVGLATAFVLALASAAIGWIVDPTFSAALLGSDGSPLVAAVVTAFAVWMIACVFTGLPVWLLLAGALVGPGQEQVGRASKV